MRETDIAIKAAKAAGEIAKKAFHEEKEVRLKGPLDLVTSTDVECEEAIKKTILSTFPDHEILAEESGITGKSDNLWIVDPIDGTVNFAYGLADFGISVAFAKNSDVKTGAIYFPMYDELFVAEKGKGATCNGQKLSVSSRAEAKEALLLHDSMFHKEGRILPTFNRISPVVFRVRISGAATRSAALIASGVCDAWMLYQQKPWDVAAGALIIKEAGGTLSDFEGNPWALDSSDLLATNGKVHGELLELLKEQ